MNDAQASVVVTADGGWRRGTIVPLKANVDGALAEAPCVKDVVVVRRTGATRSLFRSFVRAGHRRHP